MKNQLVLTAAAVPALKVADVKFNTDQIINLIMENRNCGIIVFPELCVTGYTCADLFDSELLESCPIPITALRFDASELGKTACRELLRALRDESYDPKPILGYRIISRGSTL